MASTGNWWDSEVEKVPAPAPTFGFAWAQGYVAPFSPADLDASRVALEMAAGVAGRPLTSLTFTDFGCGDGAVVLLAASLGMPTCTGIDLDESLLASATAAAAALPGGCPPGVSFARADVQTYPTQGTDVLFWHMLPDALPRSPALGDRLLDALDGGMVMVTIRWKVPLGEWEPYLRAQAGTGEKQLFFVYGRPPAATLPPSAPLPALGAGAGTLVPSLPSWDVLDGQAKEAFQRGRYDEASEAYAAAVTACGGDSSRHPEVPRLLANRAQCALQLHNFNEAVTDCSTVLRLLETETGAGEGEVEARAVRPEGAPSESYRDPALAAKATLRRGIALIGCELFERALVDLTTANHLLASTPFSELQVTARQKLREVQSLLKAQREEEAREASARAPLELLSSQHIMRLYIREPLPQAASPASPFPVSLYLSNEFGLSRRGSHAGVRVVVEAVRPDSGQRHDRVTLVTQPADPCLDDRGKCTLKVTASLVDSSVSSADFLLVLKCEGLPGSEAGAANVVPVVSVVSTPVRVEEAGVPSAGPATTWLGHNCRMFTMPGDVPPVFLLELLGSIGHRLWDAGITLLHYLAAHPGIVAGRHVVEVGSGTGVVGLGAARLGAARVHLTDMEAVVPLMAQNIALCGLGDEVEHEGSACVGGSVGGGGGCPHPGSGAQVTALALPWGQALPPSLAPSASLGLTRVVLAADVVYEPETFALLASTLRDLCAGLPDAEVWLAYRPRHPDGATFFALVGEYFHVEVVLPPGQDNISIHRMVPNNVA